MKNPNKKPFSQSIRMEDGFEVVSSLRLRQLFKSHDTIQIAADPHRHCSVWFTIDKEKFFSTTERRNDIYTYTYVVEESFNEIGSILRLHAVERNRKP